jgi:hypothetical protein
MSSDEARPSSDLDERTPTARVSEGRRRPTEVLGSHMGQTGPSQVSRGLTERAIPTHAQRSASRCGPRLQSALGSPVLASPLGISIAGTPTRQPSCPTRVPRHGVCSGDSQSLTVSRERVA